MNVYIDSNIYLDYFRKSSEKLVSLTALRNLLSQKKVKLLVPEQTAQEYNRNKGKMVEEFRKALIKQSELVAHLPVPEVREWEEAKKLTKAIEDAKDAYKSLIEKYDKVTEKEQTSSELIIEDILKLSLKTTEDKDLLERAYFRFLKGNPPRKNDSSLGDAIIWESLLIHAIDDDLSIITRDSDYIEEQKGEKTLKLFLRKEWNTKTSKSIKLFISLGEFINTVEKKKIIEEEVIREEKSNLEAHFSRGTRITAAELRTAIQSLQSSPLGLGALDASPYYGTFTSDPIMPPSVQRACPQCGSKMRKFDNMCGNCGYILESYIP